MEKKKEFLRKCELVHSKLYDYNLVEYKNNKTKVKILCKEHGVFEQKPDKHINNKQGCPKCAGNYKFNTNIFLRKAKEIHGNKYDYSLSVYTKAIDNIIIICPKHGQFKQQANLHISGSNCPMCFGRDKNNNDIIQEFKLIHGNKYDYSLVNYANAKSNIKIICPVKGHGEFEQTFTTHKKGHGCPKCVGRYKTTEEFISEAKLIHSDKYDYSLTNYKDSSNNVNIICFTHGMFSQTPSSHLMGRGCPKCKGLSIIDKKTKTTEEFVNEAKLIHNDKYNYSLVDYKNSRLKIKIICKKHGMFEQMADSHLQGCGCYKCKTIVSKNEIEVVNFIESIGVQIIKNNRQILNGLELDIYIPSHKLAIEFDGLRWHSELYVPSNYHLNKTELCEKQGIQLIHIFEDEWKYKQDIVKSRLKNILGLTEDKIYGRKTDIKEISSKDSKEFLDNNHLQGKISSSINLGLYYNNKLISVMLFNKPRLGIGKIKPETYELSRFCNKLDTSVIGGADKLLKYFIKTYNPKEIISYADRRWSQGNLYEKLNFKLDHINKPNYWYIIGDKRKHRFGFRKHKLKDDGFDILNKTEHEIMCERKIYRIYDCGTITYKKTLT